MHTRDGGGAMPGAIMPEHYQHLGAKQAKAEYAAAYEGGWEYDPEAMKEVIRELQDLRRGKVKDLEILAADVVKIDSPGEEEVSLGYVSDANLSGQTYDGLLRSSVLFLESYIDTLIEIDKAYQQQDTAAMEALRKIEV